MTLPLTAPTHAMPFCERSALLKGLGITVMVNTGIALMLWWVVGGTFDVQWVYSQAIGVSIWALTNAGARWLSRPGDPGGFPRGWRAALLVPTAVGLGALIGMTVGNLYAGAGNTMQVSAQPRVAWATMVMTFVIGGAMTLYFYLVGKSSYLQNELERTQRQTAEAQLKLLESQLEPHMLFNTLANLRVLIGLDPAKAQTMLDHLIAYLRATLAASRQPGHGGQHTLATEFERLNDYLALMAIRMGPRLRATLDLPADLRDQPIPALLLQPLVENALHHGLEPKVAGGQLVVSARRTGTPFAPLLTLSVTDDGVGTEAHLAAAHTGSGFGTTQVRERLATAYGAQAVFELTALKPTGISASLHIPLQP